MLYRLFFQDGSGQPLTLSGFKDVKDDPGFDLWRDTTTLFVRILRGHVGADEEAGADAQPDELARQVLASGVLVIHFLDLLKQLTTFRTEGPTIADRAAASRASAGSSWASSGTCTRARC
jgi:cholesterol oxidase